jgi:hypothetical protein
MALTYEPIQTTTLSSTTPFTFSSIPSTYTDLVLVINGILSTSAVNLNIRFNTDSGTNYSYTQMAGNGSSVFSARASSQTYARLDYYGYLDTNRSTHIAYIMNYANTNVYKTVLSRTGNSNNGVSAVVNLWRSTAAINSISSSGVTDLGSGSVITLYGIKAA